VLKAVRGQAGVSLNVEKKTLLICEFPPAACYPEWRPRECPFGSREMEETGRRDAVWRGTNRVVADFLLTPLRPFSHTDGDLQVNGLFVLQLS
jgi:hypothetical protein